MGGCIVTRHTAHTTSRHRTHPQVHYCTAYHLTRGARAHARTHARDASYARCLPLRCRHHSLPRLCSERHSRGLLHAHALPARGRCGRRSNLNIGRFGAQRPHLLYSGVTRHARRVASCALRTPATAFSYNTHCLLAQLLTAPSPAWMPAYYACHFRDALPRVPYLFFWFTTTYGSGCIVTALPPQHAARSPPTLSTSRRALY